MALGFERPTLGQPAVAGLLTKVTRFFDNNQWSYERLEGQPAVAIGFEGKSGAWRCIAAVNEQAQQVAFFSMVDTKVAPEKRPAVIEYITRTNYGLGLGNFEMDLTDGHVRCKTCLAVGGSELTPALLGNLVSANCELMERYVPALRKVASGEWTPDQAAQAA